MQPSASKSALLLACPRPFDPKLEEAPDDPGEAARYGSAFHELMASCLRSPAKMPFEKASGYAKKVDRVAISFDVRSAASELAGHVKGSVKVLRNWLKREKLEVVEIEQARAVRLDENGRWTSRRIDPHDDEHKYTVQSDEIPGTVDLVAVSKNRKRVVTLDHKTGHEEDWHDENGSFAKPTSLAQMRTLGLASSVYTADAVESELGILHADRIGLPVIYTEEYEVSAQREHVMALRSALDLVGSGFLRFGAQCERCSAKIDCPSYKADLLSSGAAALVSTANTLAVEPIDPKALLALPTEGGVAVSLEERAGALYDLVKKFGTLREAALEEIRRLVRSGMIIETRTGETLTIRKQTFETLSKKSVIDAFGPVAGEKELKRLRSKGALREGEREMLVSK